MARRVTSVVVFLIVLAICQTALAERTITVDDDGPADFNNIQAAINDSNNGDTIIICTGTYTGQGNRNIDFMGRAITVRSINPDDPDIVAATVIDCNGSEGNFHRGFSFVSGESQLSVLNGLTITNGYAYNQGGCIYCYESSPVIKNCVITDNKAFTDLAFHSAVGGGIYCYQSNPVIKNCVITDNTTFADAPYGGSSGGGIYCKNSSPVITDCVIVGNISETGPGGIDCYGQGNPIITNCVISENTGNDFIFGGITSSYAVTEVTNCIITNNIGAGISGNFSKVSNCTVTGNEAGIEIFDPSENCIISNCTISDNNSFGILCWADSNTVIVDSIITGNGWGIYFYESNSLVESCIISGNLAKNIYDLWYGPGNGGGINCIKSSPVITNCTITGNRAEVFGGGICAYDSSHPTLVNCILSNNMAQDGFEIALLDGEPSSLTTLYSNIRTGQAGAHIDSNCVLNWGLGNIIADPYFVEPGYWDTNSTPTDMDDDLWVDGDYHLKSQGWRWDSDTNDWTWDDVTSRCIDAGNPGFDPAYELLPNSSSRINMGVYGGTSEASIPSHNWALLADLTNDGIVNLVDFAATATNWQQSQDEQPGDLNRNGIVEISDVALLLEEWLDQTIWYGLPMIPPEIEIISPQDGNSIYEDQIITIEADAWDSDGSIVWVGFFADEFLLATDTDGSDGWTIDWLPEVTGSYILIATAIDNDGLMTTSTEVEITITCSGCPPPRP
ncbi:right-handed parallel beta-helix repeat-containing protein [Planctomycetota bacterium]